jgi:hypothetical protein
VDKASKGPGIPDFRARTYNASLFKAAKVWAMCFAFDLRASGRRRARRVRAGSLTVTLRAKPTLAVTMPRSRV